MFLVQRSQLIGYRKWCSGSTPISSTNRPNLGYFKTWPVFSLARNEKISLKPLNERSSKFRRARYSSEFDDVIVKTFYFMFRPFSPLIEVGTGDFKGKIWFAFTEYQNPPRTA